MGVYNCRVRFQNDFGTGDWPVIGRIYAKFTYYNGDTSVSEKSVTIRPGNSDYLNSRFSDDPTAECVKNLELAGSWLFEDGSADSADGEAPADPGTCTTSAKFRIYTPSFIKEGYKGRTPPVEVSISDPKAVGGERIVWRSDTAAEKEQLLEEMKEDLLKKQ